MTYPVVSEQVLAIRWALEMIPGYPPEKAEAFQALGRLEVWADAGLRGDAVLKAPE